MDARPGEPKDSPLLNFTRISLTEFMQTPQETGTRI